MPLNKSKGNMYDFITHTWNPIKGACPHGCSYCYMNKIYKRFGKEPLPPRLVENELRVDLGYGNTIFVCSSIDLFAEQINRHWQKQVIYHTLAYPNNTYLWHTKNPSRAVERLPCNKNFILCATIETDIYGYYTAPIIPTTRAAELASYHGRKMVAIEPIIDFNMDGLLACIKMIEPEQVNIGADSGNNGLPEPPAGKLRELIAELEKFTKVYQKTNLKRLLNEF